LRLNNAAILILLFLTTCLNVFFCQIMKIENEKVVSIAYTLTNAEGKELDSSDGHGPLEYLVGAGNIIDALEEALVGKSIDDEVKVTIPPEKAYGELNPSLVQTIPKSQFAGVEDIKVGMQFQTQDEQGLVIITVTKIEGDDVTVDGNHELAGQTLTFDVKIVDIRDATSHELNHGHPHAEDHVCTGSGNCQH